MSVKRTSILTRSKKAETRVVRYLFGPDAFRDWKEEHDISGTDAEGNRWVGEVKNREWPSGPGELWRRMEEALVQAEKSGCQRCFSVYIPPHCEPANALVMTRGTAGSVAMTTSAFRALIGREPEKEPDPL